VAVFRHFVCNLSKTKAFGASDWSIAMFDWQWFIWQEQPLFVCHKQKQEFRK